ncbi:ARF-like GTPase ARLP2, atypical [Purpureocillium lavendulum]|uniref:ARF-like GTPase ARLP2, atypical n=1 Tax=Purpureocillium lavendulum TaxID=1247861 RepID=A0AB34FV39_9HYPO|nr:ARF-like GTPase ARLP2, atypical [Purpureocillium lavendulum]
MIEFLCRNKILRQWLLPDRFMCRGPERRGLLTGLDGSGKTTLLYRWKLGEVVTTIPTMGFNVETVGGDGGLDLVLWDAGGSPRLRPLLRHYICSTEYVIFVHDASDHERRDEQITEFQAVAKQLAEAGGHYAWVIFNKQDLLPVAKRRRHVADLMRRYEKAAAKCSRAITVKVSDLPGLSATKSSNADLHVILEHVQEALLHGPPPNPVPMEESRTAEKLPRPDLDKLKRQAQQMIDADTLSADKFWCLFETGDLPAWNHYSHLRAGFFILVQGASSDMTLSDCAEKFINHLDRLRESDSDRFPNVINRTLTLFWLLQLHQSAFKYAQESRLNRPLSRGDFTSALLHAPELSDSGLWRDYFSKDRLFSADARERWCFSDLQPLPPVSGIPFTDASAFSIHEDSDESDRLVGFALAVAQRPHGDEEICRDDTGHALAALQSSIMRARTIDKSVPPFSETKARFWIQFVRACLAGVVPTSVDSTEHGTIRRQVPDTELTLEEFRDMFDITGEEWREHYSRVVWESVAARVAFVSPDLKRLPHALVVKPRISVGQAPRVSPDDNVEKRKMSEESSSEDDDATVVQADEVEMPSEDDLALMAAVVIDEAEMIALEETEGSMVKGNSHARMLLSLHRIFAEADRTAPAWPEGAMAAALQVPCPAADGVTQRTFWARQVLSAVMSSDAALTFEEFVEANKALANEEMPLGYYSRAIWAGEQASVRFIEPDRKPLPGGL